MNPNEKATRMKPEEIAMPSTSSGLGAAVARRMSGAKPEDFKPNPRMERLAEDLKVLRRLDFEDGF